MSSHTPPFDFLPVPDDGDEPKGWVVGPVFLKELQSELLKTGHPEIPVSQDDLDSAFRLGARFIVLVDPEKRFYLLLSFSDVQHYSRPVFEADDSLTHWVPLIYWHRLNV